jgi:glycosyltransferase involved in cell wall biosynthesis
MNILILEPFLGGSSKPFLNGLLDYSRHKLFPVTLTDKYWKWRQHGSSINLADLALDVNEPIDLIVASNFTNLPAFISLVRGRFANTPILLYMHENQITKPLPAGEDRDITYCYVNFLSTMVADRVVFSSKFHFDTFFAALPEFLDQFGEFAHKETIQTIRAKSEVLYPGLFLKRHDQWRKPKRANDRLVVLWNQRWEFDRNPSMFFRIMNRLDDAGCQFDLILAGDSEFEKPIEFERAQKRYGERVLHYGFVSNYEEYTRLLDLGDVVVSTSDHEFFGVAILEAIYCGNHPVLPRKLTYPELIPPNLHEPLLHAPVFYDDEDQLFKHMKRILDQDVALLPEASLRSVSQHMDWSVWVRKFDDLFESIVPRLDSIR